MTAEESLRSSYISNTVQQIVLFLIFGGLATSRASGHVLSATAIAGIVVVAAATSTIVGWTTNLYGAAFQVLTGVVPAQDEPAADAFGTKTLWRTSLLWSLGAAAWAGAGAGLLAAVLNGRVARFPTIFVALVGLAGVQVVAISGAARRRGIAAATSAAASTTPLRRRAWRDVAVPFAVSQALLNAGVAWLLFHSYPTGDKAIEGVLTDSTALADALLVVVPLTIIFGGLTRSMGAFDAATNRVAFDDADVQTVSRRSPIGVQFMVYTSIVGLVLARIIGIILPATPSLTAVIVARGALAGIVVFLAAGIGYVRGACNGLKAEEEAKKMGVVA
ncbi:MAG: hypothetical protein Q8K63_10210 [Acidimicrobiales bacterium]|nr:hypothetical protein [Acidimicrobiales bacterium]